MDQKAEFLPFHAINEFMRPDFRLSVIRDVLNALPKLTDEQRSTINHLTRKLVKVPGFRNSEKAPTIVKALPLAKSFEKSPELVGTILAAWADLHVELRQQIYDLLKTRNWKVLSAGEGLNIETISTELLQNWAILPLEIDRSKLPGFHIWWPKGEDFDTLYNDFTTRHPDSEVSMDQVSLMVVWLSLRLPYHIEGEDENKADPEKPSAE